MKSRFLWVQYLDSGHKLGMSMDISDVVRIHHDARMIEVRMPFSDGDRRIFLAKKSYYDLLAELFGDWEELEE